MSTLLGILFAAGAIGGGILGLASTGLDLQRGREDLARQKDSAWEAYGLGKAHSDEQYRIQQGEAMAQLGVQEKHLHEGVRQSDDQFNAMLLSRAFAENDARIQSESAIGGALAAGAAGGARNNAANGLMRGYARQGLERGLGLQRLQDGQALGGTLSQAGQAMGGIARERASWMPGGARYEQKQAQDKYNLGLANMGQKDFDWAIRQASDPQQTGLQYLSSFFSGASTGAGLVANTYSFGKEMSWWGA